MSGTPEIEEAGSRRCPSCGAGADGTFCPACGVRKIPRPLALRSFLAEALGELLSLERRLLRTIPPLLLRPGRLTLEHIAGHGGLYVSPIRLYFAGALLFFGFLTWVGVDLLPVVPVRDRRAHLAPRGALGADSVAARWPTVAMQLAALASLVAGVWRLNEQPLGWRS